MGSSAETILLAVLDAGDDEVLALLGVILNPILAVIVDVGHSNDVGDTLWVIPYFPVPF